MTARISIFLAVLCAVHGAEVRLSEAVFKGLPHYRIETPSADYWLERTGGGLSRMLDRDGEDWLGFDPRPGSGAGGEYRGFPNAVHQQAGNYFHARNAATDPCEMKIEARDENRAVITAVSSNRRWACRYEFMATHCVFTMTRAPADRKYWVLYEGTPGGGFELTDWWMTSAIDSPQPMTHGHDGDIPAPEWIVFGDPKVKRTLFLLNFEDDAYPDRFYQMHEKMTVFGFGRAGLEKFLTHSPQSFAIGFLETTNHAGIASTLKKLK